ncbi:MAG: cytochrome bd-I oxidase subunit CydX [Gammaproteobacteria bacterium]|nr:cytochrome bd-I oxidase subunit CydX [Gammaproteobacteria bacterium]
MWYFTWILGVCFAASCGIIAALWYENDPRFEQQRGSDL